MRAHPTRPTASGVYVVGGYGVKITVQRGRLVVHDGVGDDRRAARFDRISGLKRMVVLGRSGYVSLDAIQWCWDAGVEIVQLDRDRNILLTTVRREVGTNRARRVQALAPFCAIGVEAARLVTRTKIAGQRSLLPRLPSGDRADQTLESAQRSVEEAETIDQVLAAERAAARSYWECWVSIPISFAGRQDRVREHWRVFGQRSSPITGANRYAVSPAGAVLNYTLALLESETMLALQASSLDPALGIWHTDERHRSSLSLDAMEAGRTTAESLVLDLLAETKLRTRDFHEDGRGVVRTLPPLTRHLAQWMPTLAAAVEPIVLDLGRLFDCTITNADTGRLLLGAPRRPEHRRTARQARPPASHLHACRSCGTILSANGRDPYCDDCGPDRPSTAATAHQTAGTRVTQARRDSIRRQRNAALEWDRTHPERPDPATFRREILPHLAGVSYSHLSRTTGLSRRYCKLIATGENVPHPMHWDAFRAEVKPS